MSASRWAEALRRAGCVFAEDEAELLAAEASSAEQLSALVARRVGGEPLEQVLGWAGFCGLRIVVEPGVFVPRPRTEALAERALRLVRPGSVVVDMCCGSGAIGAVLAMRAQPGELHAADIDPAAVRCARRNLAGRGDVHQGDLFAALPEGLQGLVDVLVANTPYVPSAEIGLLPREAREHEPAVALDGGPDGLAVQRRLFADAPRWLAPGGHVLVEVSAAQGPAARDALARHRLDARLERDEARDATIAIGARPGGNPERAI